jgi:ComF family protein
LNFINKILGSSLRFLLPPQCLGCRTIIEDNQHVCSFCWKEIEFISDPMCKDCGFPFEVDAPDTCPNCKNDIGDLELIRSATVYEGLIKKLILRYKNASFHPLAPFFGHQLASTFLKHNIEGDVITCVPSSRKKMFLRGFNPAAQLAQAFHLNLEENPNKPLLILDLLLKVKETPSQMGLDRTTRKSNLEGAFALNPAYDISHKNIIIVDDVVTTGTTLITCAKILKAHGARKIKAVTVSRTK